MNLNGFLGYSDPPPNTKPRDFGGKYDFQMGTLHCWHFSKELLLYHYSALNNGHLEIQHLFGKIFSFFSPIGKNFQFFALLLIDFIIK
jgi:hypothetical protein